MKLITFTFLIFQAIFIHAELNVPGTLEGVVDLSPVLIFAGIEIGNFGEGSEAVANAVQENTNSCYTSGSPVFVENLIRGLIYCATNITNFAQAYANQTTNGGQLKTVTLKGNLSQVPNAAHGAAKALELASKYLKDLANNIKKVLLTKKLQKQVADAIERVAQSIFLFNVNYERIKFPSKAVLNAGVDLFGVRSGTKKATVGIYAAANATRAAEDRCNSSHVISSATQDLGNSAKQLEEITPLLGILQE